MNPKELIALPEFTQAWENAFQRIAEYDKKTLNKDGIDIINSLRTDDNKTNTNGHLNPEIVVRLATLARKDKMYDDRLSLTSDLIKILVAVGIAFADRYNKTNQDHSPSPEPQFDPINSAYKIVMGLEVVFSIISSRYGYRSMASGYLSRKLANSFCDVVKDFADELKNSTDQPSSSNQTSQTGKIHDKEFGLFQSRLGSSFSALAFIVNLSRGGSNFTEDVNVLRRVLSSSDKVAIESLSALLSLFGKHFSLSSVQTNEDKVREKISETEKFLTELHSSSNIETSKAKEILGNLSLRYKSEIKEPDRFTRYVKYPYNLLTNLVYRISYTIIKRLNPEVGNSSRIINSEPTLPNEVANPESYTLGINQPDDQKHHSEKSGSGGILTHDNLAQKPEDWGIMLESQVTDSESEDDKKNDQDRSRKLLKSTELSHHTIKSTEHSDQEKKNVFSSRPSSAPNLTQSEIVGKKPAIPHSMPPHQ